MTTEQKNWLTYWKKCLSDSMTSDIDVERLPHFEVERFSMDGISIPEAEKVNLLIDLEETRINKKKGVESRESENWVPVDVVQVVIAPFKVKPTSENRVYLKDHRPKYPFWYYAKLDRLGRLRIPEETFPVFQRKFLEPLADERTEFIFGSVEAVDQATALGKEEFDSYAEYIDYLKEVFTLATQQDIDNYSSLGYETIRNGTILLPDEDMNAAIGIIHLYEKILAEDKLPPLLQAFISLNNPKQEPPLDVAGFINTNQQHLGQMGFDFPISISQRKALYTFLHGDDKVFAVNGPPGTGKTTLLQSVVANKVVEHALKGTNAPIILACSTNNQAVTNIIDSFSNSNTRPGKLQGRWLPVVEGYGTFLPANGKTEAELNGINYKKLNGEGLFQRIENFDYPREAKMFYIQKSSAYFDTTQRSLPEITKKLQNEIAGIQGSLKEAALKWQEYKKAEKAFLSSYLSNLNGKQYYDNGLISSKKLKNDIDSLKETEQQVKTYFEKEPFFRRLFCSFGIKSTLRNRESELKILLRDSLVPLTADFTFTKIAILEKANTKIGLAQLVISALSGWQGWKQENHIKGNPPETEERYWDFEWRKINENLPPSCFYDELDVSLRHKAFQLALHYWEGRYLMQLEDDLTDPNFGKKGQSATENRWRRHAMLTPCFVSTFYMAPKFFSYYYFLVQGENGKNIFDNPALFSFVDLLIVDEAGQTPPDVGVATFALAKQSIIVGDVKQIEPIWNVSSKIDVGNLKKCRLITSYTDPVYEREYDPKGFLSSTGSIMAMAQNAANYKEPDVSEKGIMLTEHRRCYDEIIGYCNILAYNGKLVPLKGTAPAGLLFPPMHLVQVEGNSKVINSSRFNLDEVQAIIQWLKDNKVSIEAKYGKLENAVGIITPFVGQKNSLRYALKTAGFDVGTIKLGTVHALQGAERPIVLFSMVYDPGDSGTMFFDRDNKPNMLNVAVSRAKDNFIVFANKRILNKEAKTPSGILANFLK